MTEEKLSCGNCGVSGVQLWRPYGCFYRPEDNRCEACAEEDQKKPKSPEGFSIGWYVPLVMSDDGDVWGFSSAPDKDVEAWSQMPKNESPNKHKSGEQ